jgi:hypothetical protein
MQHLPRDRRGYPIPAGVWRDDQGTPHFTINDEAKRVLMVHDALCPICGTKLNPVKWFVGGPGSAFHANGWYFDPPMHRMCMHYALKVCPYLAMPEYTKRIDARTVREPQPATRIFLDRTQDPQRPLVFVAVSTATVIVKWPHIKPERPYINVEFWRGGKQITRKEAIREYLMSEDPTLKELELA